MSTPQNKICRLCGSTGVRKLCSFDPYTDLELKYEVFICASCKARYCFSKEIAENKKKLHSQRHSPYQSQYDLAMFYKEFMKIDINKTLFLLRKSPLIDKVFRYIELSSKEDLRILEVGCSTGYITALLNQIGCKSFGIDISEEPINFAKSHFGDYYGQKEQKNIKYDLIFFKGVIGCVDNPRKFLKKYLNLLSDSGVMLFNAPDVDSVNETGEIWVDSPPPDVNFLFKSASFEVILDKKNYVIETQKYTEGLYILKRNINNLIGKKNNLYPRNFFSEEVIYRQGKSSFKIFIKDILGYFGLLFAKLKLIKTYSSEYGLIIKIERRFIK